MTTEDTMPPELEPAFAHSGNALLAAVDGRDEDMGNELRALYRTGGHDAVFAACAVWSTVAATTAGLTPNAPDEVVTFQTVGLPEGVTELDATGRAAIWSAQFFAAMANGEKDTAMALYAAAHGGDDDSDQLACNVATLLHLTALIIRQHTSKEAGAMSDPTANIVYQPRCVHCGREHYAPAVLAISTGHGACHNCGHTAPVYTDPDAYRQALRKVRNQ